MKVILQQDIENLGKKYDIKSVADGYARNFLIPKSLAKPATKEALGELERLKEDFTKKAEEELKIIQETVSRLDGLEIEILVKTGDDGKLYGSVTPIRISEKLKEKSFDVKKTQIQLKEPIKEAGEYPILINFDHGLEAEIKVIVIKEE